MTDAPERIWAFYSDIFGAMWTPTEDAGAHEYTRADLTPTDAQVMAHPKVKALVEALTPSGDTKAAYMGEIKDPDTGRMVSWTAIKMIMNMITDRAALRDLGGGTP